MLDTLQRLHHYSHLNGGFEQSPWCALAERLGLLKGPGNRQPLGIDLGAFYTSTCTDLRTIAEAFELLQQHPQHFSHQDKTRAETQIRELANKLNVCGPGTSQNIESALKNIMLMVCPPDFSGQFQAKRVEIAKQIFVEFAAKHLRHEFNPIGAEIHMVTALQNHYASRFQLPLVDDRYANSSYAQLEPEAREELEQRLEYYLHPEHIAIELSQQFLQQLRASQANSTNHSLPSSPDFPMLCRELEKQKPILGDVHPSWVCDVDTNTGGIGWKSNTTLLAVHALEELRKQNGAEEHHVATPQSFAWSEHSTLQMGEKLIWCKEETGAHSQLIEAGLDELDSNVLQQWTKTNPSDPKALAVIVECLRNNSSVTSANFNDLPASELEPEMKLVICWAGLKALPEPTPQVQALIENLDKHITPAGLLLLLDSKHAEKLSEQAIKACLNYPEMTQDEILNGEALEPITLAEVVVGFDPSLENPRVRGNAKVFEQAVKIVLQQGVPRDWPDQICQAAAKASAEHLECLKIHTNWLNAQMLQTVIEIPSLFGGADKPTILWILNEISQTSLQPKLPCSVLIKLSKNPFLTDQDRLSVVETLASKELMEPPQVNAIKSFVEEALASTNKNLSSQLFPLLPKQTLAEVLTQIVCTQPELLHADKHRGFSGRLFLDFLREFGADFKMAESSFLKEIMKSKNQFMLDYALGFLEVDPNKTNADESSPLIYALETGLSAEASQLLAYGADPWVTYNSSTAFDMALPRAQNSLPWFNVAVDIFRKIHPIAELDSQGYTPLHHAVLDANQQSALLRSDNTNTAENQQQFERTLTKLKVIATGTHQPDMRSSWAHRGKTALHLAYKGGDSRIIEALESFLASNKVRDYKFRRPARLTP